MKVYRERTDGLLLVGRTTMAARPMRAPYMAQVRRLPGARGGHLVAFTVELVDGEHAVVMRSDDEDPRALPGWVPEGLPHARMVRMIVADMMIARQLGSITPPLLELDARAPGLL